jgi:7-keto-8-aminopelargonate synthetase-like enzyme
LLYKDGIYVQPINYPTVPEGTERLRFTPGPLHTDSMISEMVDKLKNSIIANQVLETSNIISFPNKAS